MYLCQFERRLELERPQDRRQSFGEHRLARARRTNKQNVADRPPIRLAFSSGLKSKRQLSEPEEAFSSGEGKPEHDISSHLRFHFGHHERSFEVIRFRLDPEVRGDAARREAFIRNGLRERLKQLNNIG
jgi:hypothetical protein